MAHGDHSQTREQSTNMVRSVDLKSTSKSWHLPTRSWATSSVMTDVPQIKTLSTLAQMYGNAIRHSRTISFVPLASDPALEWTLQYLLRSSLASPLQVGTLTDSELI